MLGLFDDWLWGSEFESLVEVVIKSLLRMVRMLRL